MCIIQDYLKSLNPEKNQQHILIFNREYDLWRDGKYLGKATWVEDSNVGNSFQKQVVDDKGRIITQVFVVDTWVLSVQNE